MTDDDQQHDDIPADPPDAPNDLDDTPENPPEGDDDGAPEAGDEPVEIPL